MTRAGSGIEAGNGSSKCPWGSATGGLGTGDEVSRMLLCAGCRTRVFTTVGAIAGGSALDILRW